MVGDCVRCASRFYPEPVRSLRDSYAYSLRPLAEIVHDAGLPMHVDGFGLEQSETFPFLAEGVCIEVKACQGRTKVRREAVEEP